MESWMVILQQNIVSCWSRSPPQCRTIPFTSSFTTQPIGPQVGMKKMEDGVLLLNRYFNYSFAALPVVHPALPVEVCSSTPMDAHYHIKFPTFYVLFLPLHTQTKHIDHTSIPTDLWTCTLTLAFSQHWKYHEFLFLHNFINSKSIFIVDLSNLSLSPCSFLWCIHL